MNVRKKTESDPTFAREIELHRRGVLRVAGVDEAGRGPLAGPVVAAAVILPAEIQLPELAGIRDSKQLQEGAREYFYEKIIRLAVGYSIAEASQREIETLNIRQATLLAMKRALERLQPQPEHVFVDGRDYPDTTIPGEAIIRGDRDCLSVGAASILAKVVRDRTMAALHTRFPQYGFDEHKGYPTAFHRAALEIFGACEQHRTTFAGVSEHILVPEPSREFQAFLRRLSHCRDREEMARLSEEIHSVKGLMTSTERFYLEQRAVRLDTLLARRERREHPTSVDEGFNRESSVIEFLACKGYRLWERNYRCRGGEIDLIVNQGSTIVFVEVKSRTSTAFGMPYEAVTNKKMQSMIRAAERYLYERGLLEGWDVRYDVVSIMAQPGQPPQIEHFEDAFRVDEV